MTPEERTVRQKQLNAWREARRASLGFPHGREMTQEQTNEQARLEGEQENARLALHDLDTARALRDTHDELQSCADPGTGRGSWRRSEQRRRRRWPPSEAGPRPTERWKS